MNTQDREQQEEAIRNAILSFYHEGHVQNDAKFYESSLHPEWRFFLFNEDGELLIVDRDEYYSWHDPKDVDPTLKWESEFYNIDITENIASVKLRLENQKVRYIDYFNMMKIDGEWWIVHKISHGTDKENS